MLQIAQPDSHSELPAPVSLRSRVLAATPPFRPVALKLLRLLGDPSVSLSRIVELLRSDAVLTADVMRLTRSVLVASRYEIKNVLQAVAWLGVDRINTLIMTTAMRALAYSGEARFARDCWRHSLATALICERLSAAAGLSKDSCYVAGLVHDIGRFALLRAWPDYGDRMHQAAMNGEDLITAERSLLSVDHGEIGRWLLAQWGCPLELQNVAARHEDGSGAPAVDRELTLLVRAASNVADLFGMSTFPLQNPGDLSGIVTHLSAGLSRELFENLGQIEAAIVLNVNGIELSLI